LSLPDIHACDNNDIPTKLVIKRRRWTILINLLITWTSNSMKSRGNLEAELKERTAFSLMDFVHSTPSMSHHHKFSEFKSSLCVITSLNIHTWSSIKQGKETHAFS
jgi:hypothetical protein